MVVDSVTTATAVTITIEVEASQQSGAPLFVNTDTIRDAVATELSIDPSTLVVEVAATSSPTASPVSDLCVEIDRRRKCKSKKARRWLGCKWSKGACAVKRADFTQPTPLDCNGVGKACCELNKRACKGTGVHARKWARKYKVNPRKACKYNKDKSMQNKTPDGKCDCRVDLLPSFLQSTHY